MILSFTNLKAELRKKIEDATGEKIISSDVKSVSQELLSSAEIIFSMGDITQEMLQKCKNLKWLFIMSAGVDELPFESLKESGIKVSNVSGIHVTQMAEQVTGEMIIFSRKLNRCMENQRNRKWFRSIGVNELLGKNLLIVGAGSIGQEIARKAKAFDMNVYGLKRHAQPLPNFDKVLNMSSFHEMLPIADYTVLVTPLTKETHMLIGKKELDLMKNDSIFINISRGDTVDEQALIKALQSGRLGGAALDVFHNEPLEAGSLLWDMPNVIITPHTSGHSPYYFDRCADLFIDSYKLYREGRPIPNLVDLDCQY